MTNINSVDRIGNESQRDEDIKNVETIKRYAFKSYQDEIVVKMPYVDTFNTFVALPAGALTGFQQYKINSIWDPDLTGVGHQPLGRDTWSAIYNYYKVLEATITVEIFDLTHNTDTVVPGSGQSSPTYYGGMLDITAAPPSTKQAWFEACEAQLNSRQQMFTKPQGYNVIASRGKNSIKFTMKWTPDLFEKNVLQGGGDPGWNAVGSDPTILEYATLIAHNPNSAAARYVNYSAKIEYIVAFKQLNKSLLNTSQ